ncbi:MAG: cytochrome-c peroxidase [Pseudomonadales bacterium]|nr:cytochrome-c peroxidase [Pseudomonadales bacterium]
MKKVAILTSLLSSFLLTACDDNDDQENKKISVLRDVITTLNLDGDPSDQSQILPIPKIADAKAQLGKKLFFSKTLGGDQETACVSCHHPLLGGGDDLSLPIGVQAVAPDLLGPGRLHDEVKADIAGMEYDAGPTVPRNAPTTFNFMLYKEAVFHDGRVEKLEDGTVRTPDSDFGTSAENADNLVHGQALFPVTSPEEMASSVFEGLSRDEIRAQLALRLTANTTWQSEFDVVYGTDTQINYSLVAEAIASYEASQLFINSPFKAFVDGDDESLSTSAINGGLLFFGGVEAGGAGCASCHSGDFFTDEGFHNIAMPQIGRGKGDGPTMDDDFGRFRETKDANDRYAFRTPTLLNVSATAPYGHAGSYDSLEDVVRHHLNPENALADYEFSLAGMVQKGIQHENARNNSQAALSLLSQQQEAGLSELHNVALSQQQVEDIVAFLQSLTDPCVEDESCLQDWIAETDAELATFEAVFQ